MTKDKKYLSLDEQISLLKSKGLIINSKKTAKKYLKNIGYYKLINGYKGPFIITAGNREGEMNFYVENTSIDSLFHLYKLDQDIKGLVFKYISNIEIMIKSVMSDYISYKYGIKETEYLKSENFRPDTLNSKQKKFIEIQSEILKTITSQVGKHKAITHYANNYGYFPFWVVSNILTLGTISLLYSKMKQIDQNEISRVFNIKPKTFESILSILQLFRNVCAHNEVIYNYRTYKSLSQKELKYIYEAYNIILDGNTGRYYHGVNDVFSLIIIFKLLLTKDQFSEFISQFNSLLNNFKKKVSETMFNEVLFTMGIVDSLDIIKKL